MALVEVLEQGGEALVVSICAGFSRANIRDVGPSVTVTVDGNNMQGQKIAEDFMDYAWATRDFTTVKLLPVAEAVAPNDYVMVPPAPCRKATCVSLGAAGFANGLPLAATPAPPEEYNGVAMEGSYM